ncbi:MAG: HlyU family transcriptional regulator, partial [Paracoccaceae bacterium]
KTHQLIRADTRATRDEAVEASITKAKQAIDQLGDTLFGLRP